MRPDAINWATKRHHVGLNVLPRQRLRRVVWRWYLLLIAVQAVLMIACYAAMMRSARLPDIAAAARRIAIVDAHWEAVQPVLLVAATALAAAALTAATCLPVMHRTFGRWTGGLHRLHEAIRGLGHGAKPQPLPIGGADEIDYLLVSFNDMAAKLTANRQELIEANEHLEQRVGERTAMLARATHVAEKASEAKGQFLATMSHEIRTPLNGVIGALTLLDRMPMDARQSQIVRHGRLAADTLLHLINNILDFSAIESGQCELNDKPFELQQVIDEAFTILAPLAGRKRVDAVCRLASNVPAICRGDAGRLRQVLVNLLTNAVKFTDTGHVELGVTLDEEQPRRLRFDVRDTGIGIPKATIDRLFTRFSQAGNDPAHTRGGTGLGLAICRQIVALMHGEIGVESTEGRGSTFWFTADLADDTAQPSEPREADPPRRALVLDSSAPVASAIKALLETRLCAATTVTNAGQFDDVLTHCREGDYDLIVLGEGATTHTMNRAISLGLTDTRLAWLTWPDAAAAATPPDRVTVLHRPVRTGELLGAMRGSDAAAATEVNLPPPLRADIRVLLVEDNAINQFIGRELLESLGVTVDLAGDGEQAIAAIQSARYDLVLMDYFMPGMDGFTTTRRVRELEAAGVLPDRTPIVALTANVMRTDRDACCAAGMDGYLAKPIVPALLREAIVEHVEHAEGQTGAGHTPHSTAPQSINTRDSEPINLDTLLALCRNDHDKLRLLLDTVEARFRDFKTQLSAIREQESDAEVQRLAHAIAGSALQCDAPALASAARDLEQTLGDRRTSAAQEVVRRLDQCLTQLERLPQPVGEKHPGREGECGPGRREYP